MISEREVAEFIKSYSASARSRIAFQWNGKHGEDFSDRNMEFREAVLRAIVEDDVPASTPLLSALLDEETSFSVEAWAASDLLTPLARKLLLQGGRDSLLAFIRCKWKSFDTEMACAVDDIPLPLLRDFQAFCEAKSTEGGADGEAFARGAEYFRGLQGV